ncbi:hypothetical protein [Sedimenticola sp.]|uniref:hypothetical protein n=1 Tax=Sedimenticola sp. TaxID=1940285 RepID=UPI003D11E91C
MIAIPPRINNRAESDAAFIRVLCALGTVLVAGVVALLAYDPIASIKLTFFFESPSLNEMVGEWSRVVGYTSAVVYGILAGILFNLVAREWELPLVAAFPVSLLLAVVGAVLVVLAIALLFFVFLVIVGIIGLFSGPW